MLDHRNKALFKSLQQDFDIKIEYVKNADGYSCYSKENRTTIFVPEDNICPASFTHELLHIYLRSKGIYIGGRLKRIILSTESLTHIYTEPLLEHMGNCLDHIKMLPLYLKLGFERRKFLVDFDKEKFTAKEVEQIQQHWKTGEALNARVVEFALEKFFAAKACPNEKYDYREKLHALSLLDEKLFAINSHLVDRWVHMEIEPKDASGDNYKMIAGDYIHQMKEWVKARLFY